MRVNTPAHPDLVEDPVIARSAATWQSRRPRNDRKAPTPNATITNMTTFHQTEPTANNALADLLKPMLPSCQVRSEQTQTIIDHPGQHCDVLVTAIGRSPVVVEAEYEPAPEAEIDAGKRLGAGVHGEIRTVEAAIALRYPTAVGSAYDLHVALANTELSYCVLYEDGSRFPASGWLTGSITDLADLIRLVSVPRKNVDKAVDTLQAGIDSAANVLNQLTQTRPDINPAIARHLNMADVPQMRRMVCSIIANAMLFHERLAGRHGIQLLDQVCGPGIANPRAGILAAWDSILSINYLDVFEVARAIVSELPTQEGSQILNIISFHVLQIAADGVNNDHDLTGQVFQRLIADRKYLATFYTLPASAALLARLAVVKIKTPSPLAGEGWGERDNTFNWSDLDAISNLRIADFACGTGALLSAVAEQITSRYERTSGDVTKLHPILMEHVLYGCDVMPSAVHITGSTLAGLQPSVSFKSSNLTTMPYGRKDDGSVAIGSLELLDPNSPFSETMPDESFDLVIMNPPFTSNTAKERIHIGTFAPAFAAFGSDETDQREMTRRLSKLKTGTCYHGHAGMASAFAALAHRKLKPGGILALVLPLTAAAASSWQQFRQMMAQAYTDMTVLSIAANGKDMAFSSDTGIAEILVIASKPNNAATIKPRLDYISLFRRPLGFAHASAIAKSAILDNARNIEDGPFGGSSLTIGDEKIGEILTAPTLPKGENLGGVRVRDYSLSQTAYALSNSRLWLPGQPDATDLGMTALDDVGSLGLYDLDIIGRPPQGPFTKIASSPTATYPALWNHNAQKETRLTCEPDSQLQVRQGMETKAAAVWTTASRSHLNREFTFGSQALAVAFTESAAIGGRVWPNVIFGNKRFDFALTVWGNGTLGLLMHWWHSSRQQSSKASLAIRSADSLPVLDFSILSNEQLATAQDIFDDFRERDLMPAYLADADPNRALLDRRIICDLLGFDEATYRAVRRLAQKWCAEPSVRGGKARPKDATYVE